MKGTLRYVRVCVHTATGYTTFEMVYGFQSTLLSALHGTPSPQYSYDAYVWELKGRLQMADEIARQKLIA
jgi:hypothetical protein